MRYDEKLLLVAIEATYGSGGSLTGANAMLAKDFDITPMEYESIDRGFVKPYLGSNEKLVYGEHALMSFKVEFQGSGTPGLPPAYSPLMRCAGFAEIITAGDSVEYVLAGDVQESAVLNFYMNNTLHVLTGARSAIKLVLDKGVYYWEFNVMGLYVDPITATAPSPDFTAFKKPTISGEGRTTDFLLFGVPVEPYKLDIDIGQAVKYTQTLVSEKIELNERDAKGSISIENIELATHDFFTDVKDSNKGDLTFTHGTTPGLIAQVYCPQVQLGTPKYADQDKTTGLDMELMFIPTSAGNDEFQVTFT